MHHLNCDRVAILTDVSRRRHNLRRLSAARPAFRRRYNGSHGGRRARSNIKWPAVRPAHLTRTRREGNAPMARPTSHSSDRRTGLPLLGLSALGIVFGDIGTSPLYTLKTVLSVGGNPPTTQAILGILSLIVWTLVIITTVKYVIVAMSIDYDGEGGILALMSLLSHKRHKRPVIVARRAAWRGADLWRWRDYPGDLGTFGTGGIERSAASITALCAAGRRGRAAGFVPDPAQGHLAYRARVRPHHGAVVSGHRGTGRLGHRQASRGIGCPESALRIALPGLGWLRSFLVLGGVFLCVTGAEALYADMGHFGPRPIRVAWSAIVFPSLVLNYAGQAAIALDGASIDDNIFFQLCPGSLRIPLVVLATLATIIASQSIITGAFSMTRQAILLGWLPRLQIKHTSEEGYGQIYVGAVNWLLLMATVGLTLFFQKSDNLAAAYGIAVSLTMLMTSALLYIAMREVWKWSRWTSGALAGLFMCVDAVFFAANSLKILDGGYVPLLLASLVYSLMYVWHRGSRAVAESLHEELVPVPEFMHEIASRHVARVPGTAVFITRALRDVPPVMVWHVKKNRSLHRKLLALTVVAESIPRIKDGSRLKITPLAEDFWRATAHYGFMERPDIPQLLQEAPALGCTLHLDDLTYYVGHETIVAREDGKGLIGWEEALYAAMARNAMHVRDFFRLPSDHVVELGRQVSI